MRRIARLSLLVLTAGLAACVTLETLEPKSPLTPEGVDLSGQWQLNVEHPHTRSYLDANTFLIFKDRRVVFYGSPNLWIGSIVIPT